MILSAFWSAVKKYLSYAPRRKLKNNAGKETDKQPTLRFGHMSIDRVLYLLIEYNIIVIKCIPIVKKSPCQEKIGRSFLNFAGNTLDPE